MKTNELIFKLGVLTLTAFLCWLFKSGWFCLALLLLFADNEKD
ncbi:MAG: hypothetical protein ACI4U3_04305 [Traorella sp.]